MNQDVDNQKQKARLALIMKTSKLRLWFYDPTTRHFCYLSEAGDYEREYNPADFAQFFHRDDVDKMRSIVFAICEGKMDTAKVSDLVAAIDSCPGDTSLYVQIHDNNGNLQFRSKAKGWR